MATTAAPEASGTTPATPEHHRSERQGRGRLASWLAVAAGLWSLCYGILGMLWALDQQQVLAYPFAPIDEDHRSASILEGAPAAVVGGVAAAHAVLGVLAAIAMARGWGTGTGRRILLGFGFGSAAVLALLIPDYTALAFVALWPLFVVFAFTGVPGTQEGLSSILYWHRVNLLVMLIGGLLWAFATIAYQRRTAGACLRCGRSAHSGGHTRWSDPDRLRRIGRIAVRVAVLSQVPYEITRLAWYFGWPLGITDDFLAEMQNTPGMLEMGLGLGAASMAGAALTHGLVARWGEIFPRWTGPLVGRRVPVLFAVIPASVVAVALIPAGLMGLRFNDSAIGWGANTPMVAFTAWGLALGTAAYCYYLRRRGACRRCGRGSELAGSG